MNSYIIPQNISVKRLKRKKSIYEPIQYIKSQYKYRCLQIHIKISKIVYKIVLHKYGILLKTWNPITKQLQWANFYDLNDKQLKIVLFFNGTPSYHKYDLSFSRVQCRIICTMLPELLISLDSQYSYCIRSTEMYQGESDTLIDLV